MVKQEGFLLLLLLLRQRLLSPPPTPPPQSASPPSAVSSEAQYSFELGLLLRCCCIALAVPALHCGCIAAASALYRHYGRIAVALRLRCRCTLRLHCRCIAVVLSIVVSLPLRCRCVSSPTGVMLACGLSAVELLGVGAMATCQRGWDTSLLPCIQDASAAAFHRKLRDSQRRHHHALLLCSASTHAYASYTSATLLCARVASILGSLLTAVGHKRSSL